LNDELVVTIEKIWFIMMQLKVLEEIDKPLDLTCSCCKGRYSASEELLDIVCCFSDFQDMRELSRYMEKLVVDLLVSEHVAQLESLYALICMRLLL